MSTFEQYQQDRRTALSWWRSLSADAQWEVYQASDWYPVMPFVAFAMSTKMIQFTWSQLREMNTTALYGFRAKQFANELEKFNGK